MKTIRLILIPFLILGFSASAQVGMYSKNPNLKDGNEIFWTIELKADGTFKYHFFRDVRAVSIENKEVENFYAYGTWILEDIHTIAFYADTTKRNDENLNNSKARYITKSPRDNTDRIIIPSLRFFKSESSYIKGLQLFKEE